MSQKHHHLVLSMSEAFFEESLRKWIFLVNCFIGIWNKSFRSVFYLAHGEVQHSILSLAGERSLGRLFKFSIRSDKGDERVPHVSDNTSS